MAVRAASQRGIAAAILCLLTYASLGAQSKQLTITGKAAPSPYGGWTLGRPPPITPPGMLYEATWQAQQADPGAHLAPPPAWEDVLREWISNRRGLVYHYHDYNPPLINSLGHALCQAGAWWDAWPASRAYFSRLTLEHCPTGIVAGGRPVARFGAMRLYNEANGSPASTIAAGEMKPFEVVVVPSQALTAAMLHEILNGPVLHARGALVVTVPRVRTAGGAEQLRDLADWLVSPSVGLDLVGGGPFYTREVDHDFAFVVAVRDLAEHQRRTLDPPATPTRSAITLVGIVKDELDLAQWLAYHATIGFDAAVLYDHGSAVPVAEVVAPLVAAHGDTFPIRVVNWNTNTQLPAQFKTAGGVDEAASREHKPQFWAYSHFLHHYGGDTEWAAFIDADEFLSVSPTLYGGRADNFLADQGPMVAAIALEWVTFGSNGHDRRPPNLMIEAYTRWGVSTGFKGLDFKHIARPSMVTRVGAHSVVVRAGQDVDVWGNSMAWSRMVRRSVVDARRGVILDQAPAALFHYRVKSVEDFEWRTRNRARSGTTGSFFDDFDQNDFLCTRMVDGGWPDRVYAWLATAERSGGGGGGGGGRRTRGSSAARSEL